MLPRAFRGAKTLLNVVRQSACVSDALESAGKQHVPMVGFPNSGIPCLVPRYRSNSPGNSHQTSKKSLYVLNVEGKRTLGPLLIGLMDYFERWLPNVGFFQV